LENPTPSQKFKAYPLTTTPPSAIVTLLAPLKHFTALKLSKLSIFGGTTSSVKKTQPQLVSIEETTPLPPTPSEILQHIGAQLRQVREQQKVSIDHLSARTQIQPRLIQAIEEGHIEMLPESVYVKGMVKRYANCLGLDGMEMSQQVPKWGAEAAMFEPTTKLQNTGFSNPSAPQLKPLHVYLGYTLAICGVGAGISHLLNNAKPQAQQVTKAAIQPRPAAGVAIAPPATAPKPSQLPNVPIEISVKNPAWAQIGVDGSTKFTGNLIVGAKLNLVATKQVTINTNNAGGILFSRDKQPPKPLGANGQKQSVTIKVSK
jgi:cytoskeletal protein RodZ